MQSKIHWKQHKECHMWLQQRLNQRKTAAIIKMLVKLGEARSWKIASGLQCTSNLCRLCEKHNKTFDHLLTRCTVLGSNKILNRCKRAFVIFVVDWVKAKKIMEKVSFCDEEILTRGHIFKNENAKFMWDQTYRRLYLKLEGKEKKVILFCKIVFPQKHNTVKKEEDKRVKFRLLAFKKQEWCKDYTVKVVPITTRCLGGQMKRDFFLAFFWKAIW